MIKIISSLDKKNIAGLSAGDEVWLTGTLYTARDQAHSRLVEAIKNGRRLPFDLKAAMIYYCGPTATPKGKVIGSCGPTTAKRMDEFTPVLLKAGISAMIGKGNRGQEAVQAIKKYKAVYFLTYAGCAALLAKYVKSKKLIAYRDLGPEGIYQLKVENFPLIVAIDSSGKNIYQEALR